MLFFFVIFIVVRGGILMGRLLFRIKLVMVLILEGVEFYKEDCKDLEEYGVC